MSELIYFEPLLTTAEAASLLRIHAKTLLRWAKLDLVPSHRLGRKVAFRASQINSWLADRYTGYVIRAAQPERA